MRSLLITAALTLAAGTATASSVEDVTSGTAVNSSVATISCSQCPPLQPKKKVSYVVPELAPGTAKLELKEIDGEMKSVRTEAWLGGSPVVFVNKASEDVIKAAAMKADPAPTGAAATSIAAVAAVDRTAKTAAVAIVARAEPVSASMDGGSRSQEFDPSGFELRLD
ncbi:plant virulence effector HPE1-like domain-containing protein [Ensifer sp. BR816]|uniref:plant virulence effector HPE1-like domain-containing protein n=1 Tax=Rhizobium sp. (strain BR816) TaxID=1057002 RepID=UPI00036C8410|nr:plant virulence effector HPE1-like domain-containing protein [Ensifer sp. BR816]